MRFLMDRSRYLVLSVFTLVAVLALTSHPALSSDGNPSSKTPEAMNLSKSIIGTWKLEAASEPGSPSGVGSRLKLFTGTHWCIIQPDPDTGVIVFQHGGRYQLSGETMKVTRDFAGDSTKGMIGGTGSFSIQIEGDTMRQADSNGVFNETWKRVK